MARKKKCVECRRFALVIDPTRGTRRYCSLDKRFLPSDTPSRRACDKFEMPETLAHWGP
ncbi:MAG: hypothetical protein ACHQ2Z_08005 [Elusimicrobiota bacterium]